MNEEKRKRLDQLEASAAEQDRKALERDLDAYLVPVAEQITAQIVPLAEHLAELDLITPDNPGTPRWVELGGEQRVVAIEADHPDDGKRLYALHGDLIVATRMRPDGRYEHAVIDENGLPIEWRTARRPDLN